MASNLLPRKGIIGVGAESKLIDTHLLDQHGRLRDLDMVSREIGDSTVQFAYLDYELRKRLARPKARGYPPRIFISYRHETPDHVRWCEGLARHLQAAGYHVDLDALALDPNPSLESLAKFVGQLAVADVAAVIVTQSYLGKGNSIRRWIFEEWLRIDALRTWGYLEVVGVIRDHGLSTDVLDLASQSAHVRFNSTLDHLIDVSDTQDYSKVLDFFGTYKGPIIAEADSTAMAHAAADSLAASREADQERARRSLASIPKNCRSTEVFLAALAAYHAAFGPHDRAEGLFRIIRQSNPSLPLAAEIATSFWLADLDLIAYALMAEVSESPSLWRHTLHHCMGQIAQAQGHGQAAINHLRFVVHYRPRNLWEQASLLPQKLAQEEQAILADLEATSRGPRDALAPRIRCERCTAEYGAAATVCSLCGVPQAAGAGTCTMCGYSVAPIANLPFCPVCHLHWSSDVGGLVVSRRPGRQFSVLWPYARPDVA